MLKNKSMYVAKYLLHPSSCSEEFQEVVNSYAKKEVAEIDSYLKKKAGELWEAIKTHQGVNSIQFSKSWPYLWQFRALSKLSIYLMQNKMLADFGSLSSGMPFKSVQIKVEENWELNIVTSPGFINREIQRSYHPAFINKDIICPTLNDELINIMENKILNSLGLLEKVFPSGYDLVRASINALVLIEQIPPLEKGQCISLTISGAPGLIVTSASPIILMAETLLHEASHSRLRAVENIEPLWKPNSARIRTPLRTDLRPFEGLFHQVYVLHWLNKLYTEIQRNNHRNALLNKNRESVSKRFQMLKENLNEGIQVLSLNKDNLTDAGEFIFEGIVGEYYDR